LLFKPEYFTTVTLAYIIFCSLTSGVYILNDIHDREEDRKHPFKKKRPIASGELSLSLAWLSALIFILLGIVSAYLLSSYFFVIAVSYLLLNLTYTHKLKEVAILDVMMIAAGFILRVYAGAVVVDLHMNVWFLLTIISLSLFIAVGKRQSERTLLSSGGLSGHRVTLSTYSTRLLDVYTTMFATATWVTYALFAFQQQFATTQGDLPIYIFSRLPRAFAAQKWLMITVPVVIFGVMRYLQLVYEQNKGESPERVLLNDKPLLASVLIYGAMIILIIYGFHA
jgi:4-hydroxybenzoate polyprenyltransferase